LKEETKPLRRSTRTKWKPSTFSKALKMTALGIGMLFIPTHITSEPSTALQTPVTNTHIFTNM
jgi:hypothetical protein